MPLKFPNILEINIFLKGHTLQNEKVLKINRQNGEQNSISPREHKKSL